MTVYEPARANPVYDGLGIPEKPAKALDGSKTLLQAYRGADCVVTLHLGT